MLDLIIKNGLLFDGLASPPIRCDMGVRDGRIVALSPDLSESAKETVAATGLWVAPGFIDIHTHYDLEVEIASGLVESVRHGVTSIVMGNCSLSLAMGEAGMLADIFQRVETFPRALIDKWLKSSVSWKTPRDYIAHLGELPLGPNVAALLGHSALRAQVMGLERSLHDLATSEELEAMKRLANEALDAGCIGISIDMVPWHMMSGRHRGRTIPSQHADFREYDLLAAICRERDAIFQVTPNPQNRRSMIDILRMSLGLLRPRLRITVLSALDSVTDRRLWRLFPLTLFVFNKLMRCNIRFQTLVEPFTIYSDGPITPLFEEFPAGVELNDCDSRPERQRLWQSPAFRRKFRHEWSDGWRKTFHRRLDLMEIVRCPDLDMEGRTFEAIARQQGADALDVFMDLLETYDTDLRWVATGANDRLEPRLALMSHEYILPGFTDAGAHVQNLGFYDGAISLLKQAVATGFLTPERAISRVTGEAARWFRLDAGVLKEGAKADFVLIRPEGLRQPVSSQVEMRDPALGGVVRMVKRNSDKVIEAVYISGEPVILRGEVMENLGRERLGEVLTLSGEGERALRQKYQNRINSEIIDHPFEDYWEVFVLKHQNPYNIAFHVAGVIIYYGVLLWALMARSLWALLFLPSSQIIGLFGHYFFERSHIDLQDAIFSFRASRCLNRMFASVLTGKYGKEIRRLNDELKEYQSMRSNGSSSNQRSPG